MEIETVLAMAVAAIAEESNNDISHITVKCIKEVKKSDLEQYITDNKITYHKYQLGE